MGLEDVHLHASCRVSGLVLPPACAVGGIRGMKLANNFPRKIGGKKRMSVSRHGRSSAPNLPPREKGIG